MPKTGFPRHILVIRLSAMGDVAMLVPVLLKLTGKYPDLRITVLTRRFFLPIFSGIKNVDVFVAEVEGRHKGIFGIRRLAKELHTLNVDAVADLHNVLRSNLLRLFLNKDLPVKQINKGRIDKKLLTRKKEKVFRQLRTSQQRYVDVFAELDLPVDLSPEEYLAKMGFSDAVAERLSKKNEKWLGIAPFAQHPSKIYPEDLMKQVLLELQKEENLKIFFFGGKNDVATLALWEQEFSNAINLAGKFTFSEELQIISNLDTMLSMDSGNAHLAANYAVPVVTLWGLTHPYSGFAPYGQPLSNCLTADREKYPEIPTSVFGKEIPKGYEDVMKTISPEKVVQKLKENLAL